MKIKYSASLFKKGNLKDLSVALTAGVMFAAEKQKTFRARIDLMDSKGKKIDEIAVCFTVIKKKPKRKKERK